MSEAKRCPRCQSAIPAGAPESLCPACLLQAGLQPSAVDPRTSPYHGPGAAFVPPTPAELRAAFPQMEILELLGKGGMGAVYKARQPHLDRLVAVKILPLESSRDPAFVERFNREARALAKLNHPHIVGIYDFGQAGGYCFFLMEYVEGVNLHQAMHAGNLKSAEALKIVPQICEALQFAHDEGVVHRDIKPENILLDKKGRVKIADFGLAKLMGKTAPEVSLTGTQQVMGTLNYMAPEQLEGSRDIDHRADIYSLGVTFYEMLTGELPLGRFVPPSQKVQIDVRLDEVVLRALERKPEQRYQHASEIKSEMDTIAGSAAPAAKSVGPASRPSYLHMVVMPVVAWAALIVVIYGCLVLFKPADPDQTVTLATPFSGLVETSTPERYFVTQGGGVLGVLVWLLLNAVWIYWGAGPGVRFVLLIASAILVGLLFFLIVISAWGYAFTVAVLLMTGLLLIFGSLVAAGFALAALYREWWQSSSGFLWKCLRSVLLLICILCLVLLASFTLSGGPGQDARFQLGVPSPWLTVSTTPGEGFRLHLLTFSTLLFLVGWLSFWAYRQSYVAAPRIERMPMSWTWRTVLLSGVAAWTPFCFLLFHVFWLPTDLVNNDGLMHAVIDDQCWPYRGIGASTVSIIPPDPIYTRLIIHEEIAVHRLGFHEGSFRLYDRPSGLTKLTYTLKLEPNPLRLRNLAKMVQPVVDEGLQPEVKDKPAKKLPNQLETDALDNFHWRYTTESGAEKSGPLLDAHVLDEWLRHFTQGSEVADEKIQAHAGVLMGILRDAAKENGGRPVSLSNLRLVSRLHHAVALTQQSLQNAAHPEYRQRALRSWNAADSAQWEPVFPILYLGVPVMLTVWIGGLWLMYLCTRGEVISPASGRA